ncbi:MAG: TonB family protein, partial [Proteobacteria bacterium]|nr:TonB family protein [Pseudomonadota bacterium]
YRTDGTVINSLALHDFLTAEDIYELPHSISSIHWSGTHLLDHSMGLLILRVVGCRRTASSCDRFFEVPIWLETGIPTEPKTNHLPQPRVFLSTDPSPVPEHTNKGHSQPFCISGQQYPAHAKAVVLSTAELLARIVHAQLPSYSKTARALNIQGSIVLEVVVLSSGEIGCVKILRGGLPLGIDDDLRSAALGWRFAPTQPDESQNSFVGRLTVEYRWVEEDHPSYSAPQPALGGRVCPASSDKVFLIDSDGYTVSSVD